MSDYLWHPHHQGLQPQSSGAIPGQQQPGSAPAGTVNFASNLGATGVGAGANSIASAAGLPMARFSMNGLSSKMPYGPPNQAPPPPAPPPLSHHAASYSFSQPPPPSPFPLTNGGSNNHTHVYAHSHSQSISHSSSSNQLGQPPPSVPSNVSGPGDFRSSSAPGVHPVAPPSSSISSNSPHRQQQLAWANISRQTSQPFHHARAAQLLLRGGTGLTILDPNHPIKPSQGGPGAVGRQALHRKDGSVSFTPASSGPELHRAASVASARSSGSGARRKSKTSSPTSSSSTAGDDEEHNWTTLDMGGLKIRYLSADLFRYTFLTTLYIPHNNISILPPCIRDLESLTVLDVSSNKLTVLPPELGMVTTLRDLFVYDNLLSALPAELGTLFQLDHLGIEGNPLPEGVMQLLDKDGTPGLISYLRDSCAVPLPPPERIWYSITDSFPLQDIDMNKPQSSPGDTFSVLSYNILCEKSATAALYGYTPSWALNWEYRKELILQEIVGYSADIICLQEVDALAYHDYFLPNLQSQDYQGVFDQKSRVRNLQEREAKMVDGCAIFFKAKNFRLRDKSLVEFGQFGRRPNIHKSDDMINRVMTKDQIAIILLLDHIASGARLIVANTHIHWDPAFRDVKLVQTAMLMEEVELMSTKFAQMPPDPDVENLRTYPDGTKIPTLVCGDFNSIPNSSVYEFLKKAKVEKDHSDFMDRDYGTYTTDGVSHRFTLESAYGPHTKELKFTNFTPSFQGQIDFIWYSSNSLSVTGVLQGLDPSYIRRVVGFPNAHFPSDHISTLAEFSWI